jgi:hypothetical protein
MVLPDLQIPFIPPVGFEPLAPPLTPPASLAAVGMSAITGTTDQKHRAAALGAAKQLSKWNFSDDCFRAGVDNGHSLVASSTHMWCGRFFLGSAAITENPDRA